MSSALPPRKPWPMKWIGLVIVLFIAAYTFLTVHYRKPNRPYEPAKDMKTRANTGRLLAAGYQRVELAALRPADGPVAQDSAVPAPGGLPAELRATLVSPPLLPGEVIAAHAPTVASANGAFVVQFRCVTPDDRHQIAGAELYVKGDEITITPRFDRLTGGLQARTRDHRIAVSVPAGALKPGSYRMTIVGEQVSRACMLQVR